MTRLLPTLRRRYVALFAVLAVMAAGFLSASVAKASTGSSSSTGMVFLIRSDGAADGPAAAAAASRIGAHLLLTDATRLTESTAAQLKALKPDVVMLVGGSMSLSSTVEQQVQALGFSTQRIAGADRFHTAHALADFAAAQPEAVGKAGPAGPRGPAGADGSPGPQGDPGPQGARVASVYENFVATGPITRAAACNAGEYLIGYHLNQSKLTVNSVDVIRPVELMKSAPQAQSISVQATVTSTPGAFLEMKVVCLTL